MGTVLRFCVTTNAQNLGVIFNLPCILEKYSTHFINGSDHEVVACYLELYEEGEVEHINGV